MSCLAVNGVIIYFSTQSRYYYDPQHPQSTTSTIKTVMVFLVRTIMPALAFSAGPSSSRILPCECFRDVLVKQNNQGTSRAMSFALTASPSDTDEAVQRQIDEYILLTRRDQEQIEEYLNTRLLLLGQEQSKLIAPSPSMKYSEETSPKSQRLLQKMKDAGTAGIISYGLVQVVFQGVSLLICMYAFYQVEGHWPDFSNAEDVAKFGGGAFAFVNVARLAVPFRLALALGGAPWIQANVLNRFKKNKDSIP